MEKKDIQAIRETMERDLESFMRSAKTLVKEACGEDEEKGCREWAQEQMDSLRRQYQELGERVRPGLDRTNSLIKEHPYWTAGALTGAGLAAISFLIVTKKKQ
jgi:ElaB/YqjD/DUF883 family membrane-anchored ribosome-binding protein